MMVFPPERQNSSSKHSLEKQVFVRTNDQRLTDVAKFNSRQGDMHRSSSR